MVLSSIKNPTVSVIVPLFNGDRYIEDCLKSVLAQTYTDYEVLVVDDGSTDDGPRRVQALADAYPERIRLFRHLNYSNQGIAATRNLGIRNARGAFVAFLDQDDLWLPDKLAQQIKYFEQNPEIGLVYGRISFVDLTGKPLKVDGYASAGKGTTGTPRRIFRSLVKENYIPSITVIVRSKCLCDIGLFDEGVRYDFEDWLVWSKLAYFYKFFFLPQVLAKRRVHGANYSVERFKSGLYLHAETHYVIALFSYLLERTDVNRQEVQKVLRDRIYLFLLKARSWGASMEDISSFATALVDAFPWQRKNIDRVSSLLPLFSPRVARFLRKVRRKIVKI